MAQRIKKVEALENFVVSVVFQNGVIKQYDTKKLFEKYPQFKRFITNDTLFEQVSVDVGGYGISWNDDLDLAAEEIWIHGQEAKEICEPDLLDILGAGLTQARERTGMTQKELAEKTHIYQGDISKIERGLANPSIKTVQRLADGMGLKVKIEFVGNGSDKLVL